MFEDTNGAAPDTGSLDSGSSAPTSTPEPVQLSDDTLIRVPGKNEPVKYGDFYRGFQSDYTKKTQEVARQRAEFERNQADWNRNKTQEENQLRALATELLSRQRQGQGGNQNSLIERLKQAQYLTGSDAAQLFEELQQGMGGTTQALQQRDQVIQGMHNYIQRLAKEVQELKGNHTTTTWDSNLRGVVKQLGLPAEAIDVAKEIYLAYEGDDLDAEFPTILKNRWEQLTNLFSAQQRAKVDAARKQPFAGIAKKGGSGVPGGMQGLKGNESAKEVSDKLWDLIQQAE